jgi:hypothetical protein
MIQKQYETNSRDRRFPNIFVHKSYQYDSDEKTRKIRTVRPENDFLNIILRPMGQCSTSNAHP